MSRMFYPSHPGETLKKDVLPELGITVTEVARQLGITRVAFSRIINGRAGISPDMAGYMVKAQCRIMDENAGCL